jgi:alpha-ketoglutarate-dependent taurine dioxygenase
VVLDGQKGCRANLWHSDVSISPKPPMGFVLYMKESPEWGGDMMWADMTAAYDALSDRTNACLEGLTPHPDLAGTVRNVVRERSQATWSPTGSLPETSSLPSARHIGAGIVRSARACAAGFSLPGPGSLSWTT